MDDKILPLIKGFAPVPLVAETTKRIACYACSVCGKVKSLENRYLAEICCSIRICSNSDCNEEARDSYSVCNKCLEKNEEKRELERFNKATKIPYSEWIGERLYSDLTQEYFSSWESYEDSFVEVVPDTEEYLYGSKLCKMSMDAMRIVDDALDGFSEDAVESVDPASLQILLDKWCDEHGAENYFPCYDIVVMAPLDLDKN